MKEFLIKLRSRFSPKNSYNVSSKADFQSEANILNSKISVEAGNRVRLAKGTRLRNLEISIKGKNNELIVGEDTFLVGRIELHGDNNRIEIGKNTRLTGTLLVAHHGTKITIGEKCMVAADTDIRTTDSHPIYNSDGVRINHDKEIGDRVWLARFASILKGSTIGPDCVIGYKSLVSGKIPRNTVSVGVPAKVVKTGITWARTLAEGPPQISKAPN